MPLPPTIGDILGGRYRVDALLGSGGMATVVRAHDEQLDRTVALKVFPPGLVDDVQRRDGEAKTLAGLAHPGLVTLFDAELDDDPAYLVMEFVDGRDLHATLRDGSLTPDGVLALLGAVGAALDAVHARGLVHRDVKPANILVPAEGGPAAARLADFGIARLVDATRLTATGTLIGTAAYIAPEQLRGEPGGPPADVYALGLVLLEALTGAPAYPGGSAEAALVRLSAPPVIPPLPPAWHRLLDRMTAGDPADRITVADALAAIPELRSELPQVSNGADPAPTVPFGATEGNPATRVLPDGRTIPAATAAATEVIPAAGARPEVDGTTAPGARRRNTLAIAGVSLAVVALVAAAMGLGFALRSHPIGAATTQKPTTQEPTTDATPAAAQHTSTPTPTPTLPAQDVTPIAELDAAIAGDPALGAIRDRLVAALIAGEEDAARQAAVELASAAHDQGRGKEGSDRRKAIEQALRDLAAANGAALGDDGPAAGPGDANPSGPGSGGPAGPGADD